MDNEVKISVTSEDNTDAGFRSADAKANGFASKMKGLFTKAGTDSGEGFGLSFAQRVGPLVAKAPIHPALLGAVAAAAPAISVLLSQALTVGAAGGAVALGAALSAQDPRVAHGIESLKAHVGSELRISARPFIPAMLEATDRAKGFIRTIRPELDATFAKASTYLNPLYEGLEGFTRNALPGFRSMVDSAEPLVDILRDELPELGKDFADTMETIGETATKNADEFRLMLDVVGLVVQHVGSMVSMMDFLASGPIRTIADIFGETPDKIDPVTEAAEQATDALEDQAKVMREVRNLAAEYADALDRIKDQNISAAEATLDYREELEEAKDAMDKKKKVSREEERALIDLAKSSNDLTGALDDQGRSAQDASEHHKRLRQDFIRAAIQAGHTKEAAERLADQYLKIPRNVRTNVQANTDAARREVEEYKRLLSTIKRNISTNFNAGTYYGGLAHGGIASAQDGGQRSGLTMVGEYGRELVDLPPGAHVRSNPDTERMLAAAGGGGWGGVLEVRPAPGANSALMNEIVKGLIFTIRTEGQGDAQAFFGRN
jgi:hypothetical protein